MGSSVVIVYISSAKTVLSFLFHSFKIMIVETDGTCDLFAHMEESFWLFDDEIKRRIRITDVLNFFAVFMLASS